MPALLLALSLLVLVGSARAAEQTFQSRGEILAAMDDLRWENILEWADDNSRTAMDSATEDAQLHEMARSCVARWPRRGPVTLAHYQALDLGPRIDETACWLGGYGVEIERHEAGLEVYRTMRWVNPDGSRLIAKFVVGPKRLGGRLVGLAQEGLSVAPTDPAERAQIASLESARAAALAKRRARLRAREAAKEAKTEAERERVLQAEPCMVGEIKLDRESGLYYLPTDVPYGEFRDRERITCTQTERGARSYGYKSMGEGQ